MPLGRMGRRGVLAFIAAAALAVSMTSSITRSDAFFGLISRLLC